VMRRPYRQDDQLSGANDWKLDDAIAAGNVNVAITIHRNAHASFGQQLRHRIGAGSHPKDVGALQTNTSTGHTAYPRSLDGLRTWDVSPVSAEGRPLHPASSP